LERSPVTSRSSTGGSSPGCGPATARKWFACLIALAVALARLFPVGRAKWYAPKTRPALSLAFRFVVYVLSA